jgi:hypothetical protein
LLQSSFLGILDPELGRGSICRDEGF